MIEDLRVSVTDRCNRCQYAAAEGLPWLDREQILRFEEIERLVRLFASMGVKDVRLTGGEPLVRRDFPALVRMLAAIDTLQDLSLTTSGYLLEAWRPTSPQQACGASTCRSTRCHGTASSRSRGATPSPR